MNVFKKGIILCIGLCFCTRLCAQYTVKGCCKDSKEAIPNVSVILKNPKDTAKIVFSTISGMDGGFLLKGVKNGSYTLEMSCIGYKKHSCPLAVSDSMDLGTVRMQEDLVALKEVVVNADMLKSFGNRDEIFIGKEQLKIGTNALDVIGSLPLFRQQALSDKLFTFDGKDILVLIDGRKASPEELSVLDPTDIKKLVYYSQAPMRYAHSAGSSVVLDVIIKRRRDIRCLVYLSTNNSVTTGYGTDRITYNYSDSLNLFSASYFIDYRDVNDNRDNRNYTYQEKEASRYNSYVGMPSSYSGQYHIGKLTYQRDFKKDIFNVQATYRKSPGIYKYGQQVTLKQDGQALRGTRKNRLKSDYDGFSLDLYYLKTLTPNNTLTFNVVNTYYTSESDNMLVREMEGEDTSLDYSSNNSYRNKSYSMIAEAVYSSKLGKGVWNVGAYFAYKNFNQTHNEDEQSKSKLDYNREYIHSDYTNKTGRLSYTGGLSYENINYHPANSQSYHFHVFRPTLTLTYALARRMSLHLNSTILSKIPQMGNLTENKTLIDEHYYSVGNTSLKAFYQIDNELNYRFTSRNKKFFLNASAEYAYSHRPNVPVLYQDGDSFIRQMRSIERIDDYGFALTLSWTPEKWITFSPFYKYDKMRYDTPTSRINHSYHNYGMSIRCLWKEFQLQLNSNMPVTTVQGDFYRKYGYNGSAALLWKHKRISLGATWASARQPLKESAHIPDFSYTTGVDWNNYRNVLFANFTYRLTKGKTKLYKKHLNNEDGDSGLTEQTSAK